MSRETQKRIVSGPIEVALLDEIAERLLSLETMAKAEVSEGVVEPIEKFRITSQRLSIKRREPWMSMTLINDGPHSVFVIVNTDKSFDDHEVLNGETYTIDMHRPKIADMLLWCNTGETGSVRIVGVR